MNDSDDSEEYKPDLSEEAKAIQFEWTPELVSIRIADGSIHPLAGPLKMHDGLPTYNLGPDVALPDPSDTPECLKWMGLSEKKTTELMQNFNALDSNYQAPVHGYDEKFSSNGKNGITFPLLDKLSNLFLEELPWYSDDYEYTHGLHQKGHPAGTPSRIRHILWIARDQSSGY
ncbi:unnamed protein product [Penicillium olsonii]|uniref:Uncharacterized protein n=1 Tax=Penicillium olsonii TaxID=99116 RepID=A0A9W4HVZ3_PENOL|nr:unnamed protein product [Penicillium olsonii]CAG8139071.1 unnamed protein product [Penicillium olsonii]